MLHEVVKAEVKDRAAIAREKFQEVTERVVHEVVESETFKKHVAFNVEDHQQRKIGDAILRDTSPEPMFANIPREQIGYVTVFVSRVAGLKAQSSQVYVEVQVEGETLRTPISTDGTRFDWDKKMFDWEEREHTLKFPVTDIKAGIIIRIMTENVITTDKIIGQVLIPLERLLPSFSDEFHSAFKKKFEDRETRFVEGPSVYELYPLGRNRTVFQPAVKDSAKTGMNKPTEPLGYARIKTEFIPNEAATHKFWATKAYFSTVPFAFKPKVTSLKNVNLDVARTQRHVSRQLNRLEAVGERILFGPFAPTMAFAHARSWESTQFSVSFVLIVSLGLLYLPVYFLPILLFAIMCTGGYLSRNLGEQPPVVWNEDIRDPDDALNPMQRIAKLLWVLETLSVNLVYYADFFERFVHAFGFRDERVSILMFTSAFFMSIGLSIFAYFVPFRVVVFLGFCAWTFAPIDYYSKYLRIKYSIKNGKSLYYDPFLQPLVNVIMRIPTTEQLGHLSICEDQKVQNRAVVERVERIVVQEN
jgi:hypothetical protein